MPLLLTKFYANAPKSYDLPKAIAEGEVDRGAVLAAVRRVLKMMEHLD
jgi:hypothetical protein